MVGFECEGEDDDVVFFFLLIPLTNLLSDEGRPFFLGTLTAFDSTGREEEEEEEEEEDEEKVEGEAGDERAPGWDARAASGSDGLTLPSYIST